MYTLFYVTQKIYFEFNAPNLLPYKGLNSSVIEGLNGI
jgi:hypothetical protein